MQEVKQYGGWIIENIMDSTLFWSVSYTHLTLPTKRIV